MPRAHAHFSPQNRALVTSGNWVTVNAAGFRLPPGGGPFRSGRDSLDAHLCPLLHFPRSPTADRSQVQKPLEI